MARCILTPRRISIFLASLRDLAFGVIRDEEANDCSIRLPHRFVIMDQFFRKVPLLQNNPGGLHMKYTICYLSAYIAEDCGNGLMGLVATNSRFKTTSVINALVHQTLGVRTITFLSTPALPAPYAWVTIDIFVHRGINAQAYGASAHEISSPPQLRVGRCSAFLLINTSSSMT